MSTAGSRGFDASSVRFIARRSNGALAAPIEALMLVDRAERTAVHAPGS